MQFNEMNVTCSLYFKDTWLSAMCYVFWRAFTCSNC